MNWFSLSQSLEASINDYKKVLAIPKVKPRNGSLTLLKIEVVTSHMRLRSFKSLYLLDLFRPQMAPVAMIITA